MEEYIRRRYNTVPQFISTQSLLSLCKYTKRTPEARVYIWWWEQAELDLSGSRDVATAAVGEVVGGEMDKLQGENRKTPGLGHR